MNISVVFLLGLTTTSGELTGDDTRSPPPLLVPVNEALRQAQTYFGHTLNLTKKKPEDADMREARLCRPTDDEFKELAVGVKKFGAYLHGVASPKLDEAVSHQKEASDKMTLAYDLYNRLMHDCDIKENVPTSNPWNSDEWKKKRGRYRLAYMMTRTRDVGKRGFPVPQRRSQQEWEEVFLADDKTQASATEASWSAAVYDAEQEALDASTMFRGAARLLREAARDETIDRHGKLKQASDVWCELSDHHARVREQFEFVWGVHDEINAAPYNETGPAMEEARYFSLIWKSIPDLLQKLDSALKAWSQDEIASRGKKVVSSAATFDAKLQRIENQLKRLNEDILKAEAFVQGRAIPATSWHGRNDTYPYPDYDTFHSAMQGTPTA